MAELPNIKVEWDVVDALTRVALHTGLSSMAADVMAAQEARLRGCAVDLVRVTTTVERKTVRRYDPQAQDG